MIDPNRLLNTFLDLARIDGISGHERGVAEAVQARLTALGVSNGLDRADENFGGDCGNLLARLPGTVPAPAILLCAHMDTILPTQGLSVVVDGERVSTDKTTILGADDRAGIAMILEILQVLIEGRLDHGPIDVLFSVAEEAGMHGAKAVDISALDATMGFVFDSSALCGKFVVEAPAAMAFRTLVRGRAAHAAVSPEKGIHAIQIAARAIARLPLGRHGLTGMLNVGTICGGTAINVVPDAVEVLGETRSADPVALDAQVRLVNEAFERAAIDAGGRAETTWIRKYGGFELDPAAPVVSAAIRGIRAAGSEPEQIRYPGGSDANVLNDRGIPTVNLGIGTDNVHSTRESMPICNLVQGAQIGLNIVLGMVSSHHAVPSEGARTSGPA
jgi:tripeptide aminopeptidase